MTKPANDVAGAQPPADPDLPIGPGDVQAAARAIAGQVVDTPCVRSRTLSTICGADIWVKFDNQQFTASFKERGALNKLLSLDDAERAAGVIACSAGNHAQGVAYHAQRLGIPATIVMPRFTPNAKVQQTRVFGPEIVLHGAVFDEAAAHCAELQRERGLTLVHPYDDPLVMAGQGTVALEVLATAPDLDVLVVPIGGGGLVSGVAVAARDARPDIEIVGVQTERFAGMVHAVRGDGPAFGTATIAEGIGVKDPGHLTRRVVDALVDDILLVSEEDLERAVLLYLEIEKTVAEGAGAAGLAAVLRHRERFEGRKVGLLLCGGNIDLMILSSVIQRGLARSRRLVRIRVELPDVPGALGEISRLLGDLDSNIVEINHQRAFGSSSVRAAEVEFVLQMRGEEQVEQVLAGLDDAGYAARLV